MEKMTVQQAINVMEKYTDITLSKVVIEAHNMAIEALEKQIAKKVLIKEYESGFKENRCPICKQQLSPLDIETYCGYCGQKLDWGESNA